jgi:aspartate aminotransferase
MVSHPVSNRGGHDHKLAVGIAPHLGLIPLKSDAPVNFVQGLNTLTRTFWGRITHRGFKTGSAAELSLIEFQQLSRRAPNIFVLQRYKGCFTSGSNRMIPFATRMDQLGTESAFEYMAKAKQLEAQGRDIIHLEIGQPDFPTAPHISSAAYAAMQAGYTGYGPAAGLPELRQAIAKHLTDTRHLSVNPEQVVVMPGAKPVIFFTMLALVNPGDEVIYPDPGFPIYASVANFVGAKSVPLPLRETVDFRFQLGELQTLVSERTKLLILNSPQNPTGGVLTSEDLAEIAELAQRYDFYVLADEIYARMLYDQTHHSIATHPGMAERTILLDGFSKTYAMTGWRLGYAVASEAIAAKLTQLMINSNSCTCSFTQMAGVTALQGSQAFVEAMVDAFQQRRDCLVAGLNQIPSLSCRLPNGAFYAFPNVSQVTTDDKALADFLLAEAGVATLPGSSFGAQGQGYLRLSYANSLEAIERAIERMGNALKSPPVFNAS